MDGDWTGGVAHKIEQEEKGVDYMECRLGDLCCKEVIGVGDGMRYGFVGDVEFDTENGNVRALVIYGRLRFFGLLGREADRVFPWSSVRRFGEDIILVDGDGERVEGQRNGSWEDIIEI